MPDISLPLDEKGQQDLITILDAAAGYLRLQGVEIISRLAKQLGDAQRAAQIQKAAIKGAGEPEA